MSECSFCGARSEDETRFVKFFDGRRACVADVACRGRMQSQFVGVKSEVERIKHLQDDVRVLSESCDRYKQQMLHLRDDAEKARNEVERLKREKADLWEIVQRERYAREVMMSGLVRFAETVAPQPKSCTGTEIRLWKDGG